MAQIKTRLKNGSNSQLGPKHEVSREPERLVKAWQQVDLLDRRVPEFRNYILRCMDRLVQKSKSIQ